MDAGDRRFRQPPAGARAFASATEGCEVLFAEQQLGGLTHPRDREGLTDPPVVEAVERRDPRGVAELVAVGALPRGVARVEGVGHPPHLPDSDRRPTRVIELATEDLEVL